MIRTSCFQRIMVKLYEGGSLVLCYLGCATVWGGQNPDFATCVTTSSVTTTAKEKRIRVFAYLAEH